MLARDSICYFAVAFGELLIMHFCKPGHGPPTSCYSRWSSYQYCQSKIFHHRDSGTCGLVSIPGYSNDHVITFTTT